MLSSLIAANHYNRPNTQSVLKSKFVLRWQDIYNKLAQDTVELRGRDDLININ